MYCSFGTSIFSQKDTLGLLPLIKLVSPELSQADQWWMVMVNDMTAQFSSVIWRAPRSTLNMFMFGSKLQVPSLKLTNIAYSPLKMMVSNRNLLFQRFIFRCYVSFREGSCGSSCSHMTSVLAFSREWLVGPMSDKPTGLDHGDPAGAQRGVQQSPDPD